MNTERMMTCSILGCGWLGLPLASYLISKGLVVKGSTTREEKLNFLESQRIYPYLVQLSPDGYTGDLSAFLETDILVLNFPPDRKSPDVGKSFPATMQRLLGAIRQSPVSHIIFVGSTSVYGERGGGKATEESPLEPSRSSGKALVAVENMLAESGVTSTLLRMAGLTGYNRKPGRFLAGRNNLGMGNAPVNLVHQNDSIRAIWEVIHQNKWGEIYNVCANLHPTRREFYTYAAQQLGLPAPEFLPDGLPIGKWVSSEKLISELNFKFSYPSPFEMVESSSKVMQ